MEVAKRIIPCLDVRNGRTVKGVNFIDLKDAGDIVELAQRYSEEGADELVFLDISAGEEERKTMTSWVREVAMAVRIPFTVGGGIASEWDVERLLKNGADKIELNSAALADPALIGRLAVAFGRQCVVVAIDAAFKEERWRVYSRGGRIETPRELLEWAGEAEERGAGEILFTAIDRDGTRRGYACETTARLSERLSVPLVASGGAGCLRDFYEVLTVGKADAALAAGVLHDRGIRLPVLKEYLIKNGLKIRYDEGTGYPYEK